MSNRNNPYNQDPDQRTVGSISGFDIITTQTEEGANPTSDHDYTIIDLELLLRAVRKMFNPEYLDQIEELIFKHVHDLNNPHQLDLEKLNTNVVQELYKVWKDKGNVGTREQFLKVIFQYVKIADIETALKGKAYDEITSVKGVASMLEQHNTSMEAHDILFGNLFPGKEVRFDPSFGIKAYLGLPHNAAVTRNSPMHVISANGVLEEVPANTLVPDYSLGAAALPVFGATTNKILHSEAFADTNLYRCTNGSIATSDVYPDIRNAGAFSKVFLEKNTADASWHCIEYIGANITTVVNQYYTVSCFVKPYGRTAVGIQVPSDAVGTEFPFVQFDLAENKVFWHTEVANIFGRCYPLYTGWYRIQLTFKAVKAVKLVPRLYSLDIYDGDQTFEGINGAGFALFGLMCTETGYITPYIPTTGREASIAATTLSVPISSEWYNASQGTFVLDLEHHNTIALERNHDILSVANGTASISLNIKYPPGYRDRVYFQAYSTTGTSLTSMWSASDTRHRLSAIYTYSPKRHLAATYGDISATDTVQAIQGSPTNLYIGINRTGTNQLDGYFYGIDYYPFTCEEDHVKFFRGEI